MDEEINQLKLNRNAVVDQLNLINIVHQPQPIEIHRIRNGRSKSPSKSSGNFEVIDEAKLTMYSYLAQRELKTKEWLSKFEQMNVSNSCDEAKKVLGHKKKVVINEKKINRAPKSILKSPSSTSTIKPGSKQDLAQKLAIITASEQPVKLVSEFGELKKSSDEAIRSLELMERQLNEFKSDRLKIIFNDPSEEKKHDKQNLEQIKHLSRSAYDFQNQLSQLRDVISSQASLGKSNQAGSPVSRLGHIIRQLARIVTSFAELYPYRPDNNKIYDRLSAHFYKQLRLAVETYSQCVGLVAKKNPDAVSVNTTDKLFILLAECDRYFQPVEEKKETKQQFDSNTRPEIKRAIKSANVINIVRVPRESAKRNSLSPVKVEVVFTKSIFEKKSISKPRLEISPNRTKEKPTFVKKTVKSAKLFPSKKPSLIKPKISLLSSNQIGGQIQKGQVPTVSNLNGPIQAERDHQLTQNGHMFRLNHSLEDLGIISKQISSQSMNAFEHLSSPIVIKNKKKRSRSYESLNRFGSKSPTRSLSKPKEDVSIGEPKPRHIKWSIDDDTRPSIKRPSNESVEAVRNFTRMSQASRSRSRSPNVQRYIDRIDRIQMESDIIRRKYGKISFQSSSGNSSTTEASTIRRPYEECYVKKDRADVDLIMREYDTSVSMDKVYKQLAKPTVKQMERVMNYASSFANYYQKTSTTSIGASKFDDYDLFELLSEELFAECLASIHEELDSFNQELANDMINNEFGVENDPRELNNSLDESRSSPRQRSRPGSVIRSRAQSTNTTYSSFDSNNDSLTTISN